MGTTGSGGTEGPGGSGSPRECRSRVGVFSRGLSMGLSCKTCFSSLSLSEEPVLLFVFPVFVFVSLDSFLDLCLCSSSLNTSEDLSVAELLPLLPLADRVLFQNLPLCSSCSCSLPCLLFEIPDFELTVLHSTVSYSDDVVPGCTTSTSFGGTCSVLGGRGCESYVCALIAGSGGCVLFGGTCCTCWTVDVLSGSSLSERGICDV